MLGESNRTLEAGPWSPRQIGLLAVLLSPLPAAVVHALNWKRLGYPERVRWELAKNGVAVALFAVVGITQSLPWVVLAVMNFGFAGYFGATQLPAYNSVRRRGAKRASFVAPSLYSVVGVVGLMGLLMAAGWVAGAVQLQRLDSMLENGEYEAYEATMIEWLEEDSTDAGAHWNLAVVYSEMERWPEVVAHLRRYTALRPEDEEGAAWLSDVELYLEDPEAYSGSSDVDAR